MNEQRLNCEIINALNIRRLFSVLMNLAHLIRVCYFTFPSLQSSFICFSKAKLLSIVMSRNFSLEVPSITEFLLLMGFALKGDKTK